MHTLPRPPFCFFILFFAHHRFIVDHSGMRDPSTPEGGDASSSSPGSSTSAPRPVWQGRVLVHSLFESLCQGCFEKQWRRKISACRGIRKACAVMNWQTARAFEFKLMQVLLEALGGSGGSHHFESLGLCFAE